MEDKILVYTAPITKETTTLLLDEDYSILVGKVKLKLEKSKLDINGNPTYRLYVVDSEFIPLYFVTNNYAEENFYKITSFHITDSLNTAFEELLSKQNI
jgi:hypothetical protein